MLFTEIKKRLGFLKPLRDGLRRVPVEWARFLGRKSLRFGGPVGTFRGLDLPEARLVLPGQQLRPASPDGLRQQARLGQNSQQPWPIFWAHFRNARLVGPSLALLDAKKRMLLESGYGEPHARRDPSYNYRSLPPATRLDGPWTSVMSIWCSNAECRFYHWMLDGVPRLALLDRFPAETRILVPAVSYSYFQESLEILGVADRCRPTPEQHLEVDDYYFSAPPAMTGTDHPYAYQFLRSKFLRAAKPVPESPRKIYISRRRSSRSSPQEPAVVDFLGSRGWTILETENLSLAEQIGIFSQAECICGIHGGGLTNLLWCQPGCRVLELCAGNFLNGCFEGMSSHLDLKYRFLIFPGDVHLRPQIDLARLKTAIEELEAQSAAGLTS